MRGPAAMVLALAAWSVCGCTSTSSLRQAFKTADYADPTEGSDDPWVARTGVEARGDRPKESADEPRWFREWTMSDRAREIERNLGIYD